MTELRAWIDGVDPAFELRCDAGTCQVTSGPALTLAREQLPVVLLARLGLGPRPVPEPPAIRLAPGPMTALVGQGQAHGHGLDEAVATALQRRLDGGVRHWSVRLEAREGRLRRNLEVLEGERGIWRITPGEDGLIELAPTTTTAVVRALVAMLRAQPASRS